MSEAELNNPNFQKDHKELPSGNKVIYREINKALDGKPFDYYKTGESLPAGLPGMSKDQVVVYLQIYNRYKKFGLPHGNGWAHELPWVIDLLSFLDDVFSDIQKWHLDNAAQGIETADPSAFGLGA